MKTLRNYITMMAAGAAMTTASFAQEAAKEKAAAPARNAITPGELVIDPPTLICLGFYWPMEGDENHNAITAIKFRKKGGQTWRSGLP